MRTLHDHIMWLLTHPLDRATLIVDGEEIPVSNLAAVRLLIEMRDFRSLDPLTPDEVIDAVCRVSRLERESLPTDAWIAAAYILHEDLGIQHASITRILDLTDYSKATRWCRTAEKRIRTDAEFRVFIITCRRELIR